EPTLSILALTGLKPLIPGEPTAGPVAVARPCGEPAAAHYALAGFSLQISGLAPEAARGGCKATPHPPLAPRRPPDGARGAGGAACSVRQASRRDGSGRERPSLASPALRTVRAIFTAHGSSLVRLHDGHSQGVHLYVAVRMEQYPIGKEV